MTFIFYPRQINYRYLFVNKTGIYIQPFYGPQVYKTLSSRPYETFSQKPILGDKSIKIYVDFFIQDLEPFLILI